MFDFIGVYECNNHVINIIWLILSEVIEVEEKALYWGDRVLEKGESNLHWLEVTVDS